jgi:class 3 adenylate cyclase
LERRVAERTAELAQAQAKLETLNADLQQQVAEQVFAIEQADYLKRYLSPRVVDHLTSGDRVMDQATRRRNLSILFVDVRGFTAFSEEVEPEELVELLNELLTRLTTVVFDHGGTLDKYLGDGLMAFFGDPVPSEDHAEQAVRAALAMREGVERMQKRWFAAGQGALGVGIGIATGYVTVGTIGAPTRLEYTVIGNNVNLAARLCGLASAGEILASARTVSDVRHLVQWRSRGEVPVKGRRRPVQIAEILGRSQPELHPERAEAAY